MCFARVPSRHQLAGPGRHRCPSGPAAGVRAVADGQPQADIAAVSGAAATAPRPGQDLVGRAVPAGMVARGPASPDFGSALGGPAELEVAGVGSRPGSAPGLLPNTRLDADGAARWRGARGRAMIQVAVAAAPRAAVRGPAGQTQIR